MSSQRVRDELKGNIELLLAGLGIALTVWFGVRADEPESLNRPGLVEGS